MSKIGTYILEPLENISTTTVDEQCKGFISDIIYRLFYSNYNEIRNLQMEGKINKEIFSDIILTIFEEEKEHLLSLYTNIANARLIILDAYINKSKLIIEMEIEVVGTNGKLIKKKHSVNI